MKYYAGIGSRSTPAHECDLLTRLGRSLEELGYVLRSGGAQGADQAFEQGVQNPERKEIFKAHHATVEALELAKAVHPAWSRCSEYAKKLHARNAQIILGKKLDTPVDFVLAWTLDITRGGTSLGMRLARKQGIPVYNLANPEEELHFVTQIFPGL